MGRNLSLQTRRRNARNISKRVQGPWGRRLFYGLGNRATLTTSIAGANNDITYIAKTPGTGGNSVTVAYSVTNTNAALTTAVTGTNNDLVYTAVEPGAAGNSISVTYVNPGTASAALAVTVADKDITVSLATNGSSVVTSTAAQVSAAVAADSAAAALVGTPANAGGNDGTGVVAAMSKANLTGAASAGTPSVGVSTNAITVTTVNASAAAVVAAVNASAAASALVWAETAPANDGTGTVRTLSATNLAGAV
jgi:hypothetical protein